MKKNLLIDVFIHHQPSAALMAPSQSGWVSVGQGHLQQSKDSLPPSTPPSSSPRSAGGDAVMWSPSMAGLLGARQGVTPGCTLIETQGRLAEWGLFVMVKRALPVCPVCWYPSDEVVKSGLFHSDDKIDILCVLLLFVSSSPKNASFSAFSAPQPEIKSSFWTKKSAVLFFLVLNNLWEPKQFVSVVVKNKNSSISFDG